MHYIVGLLYRQVCLVYDCICVKGTHLITGAIMLNGVACGMIYRPLTETTRKPDIGTRAAQYRCASEEKRCTRAVSTRSLSRDGAAMTKDGCFVDVEVADSRSLHGLSDFLTSSTGVGTQSAVKFLSLVSS